MLFVKYTWADQSTPRFRDELRADAVKDPYGDCYQHPGYRYQTATQLLDINTRRLVPMCFLSERYLEACRAEFRWALDVGAAGILFDEACRHTPALLCFDTGHGHRAGVPVYANDRELIHRLRADAGRREFLFAGGAATTGCSMPTNCPTTAATPSGTCR